MPALCGIPKPTSNLYPFQFRAVSTTVSGLDNLVIQPTEKGKCLDMSAKVGTKTNTSLFCCNATG